MLKKKVSQENNENYQESAFDTPQVHTPPPFYTKRKRILIATSLTIIVIFLTSLNYFWHYQQKQRNPVITAEREQASIIAKVAQLIELPNNESPTIATVSDITKLKSQPFFQHAENGDIVLIYSKANEAILYDPTTNKILELAPINGSSQADTANAAVAGASTQALSVSQTPASVTVALYNGTTISGLTRKVQEELAQTMPNVTVVQNTNASKQNYTNTIVIDLTGKNATAAQKLAKILQGAVGSMPSNESVPTDADILVILGTTN